MKDSKQEKVKFDTVSRFGVVTLNRPDVLNALDLDMVRLITGKLTEWRDDPAVQGVIFRGAGERAFCAGGDIRAMYVSQINRTPEIEQFFDEEYELDCLIHRYPKLTIALLDGVVMGGGMGIGQGCRIRVVTERTRMAMPETTIGLFPDVGASYFLARVPFPLALYIGMVGDALNGQDALECGLADRFLPAERLKDLPQVLHSLMNEKAVTVLEADAVPVAAVLTQSVSDAVNRHFSYGDAVAVMASLETEMSGGGGREWSERIFAKMLTQSPLMMQVTYEQLCRGRTLELEACFAMERTMMRHCFAPYGDAMEGIRALVIDKDRSPAWQHRTVKDVRPADVARFFEAAALRLK